MTLFALSGARQKKKSIFSWYARFHIVSWATLSDHDFKKITKILTFAPIHLLWEIDMIMRKLANTNFMSWDATDNFLEGFEVAVATL